MPNIFTLIGESWEYYRKQPVLNLVALWLIIIPLTLMSWLNTFLEEQAVLMEAGLENMFSEPRVMQMGLVLLAVFIILTLWTVWGSACTLLVGKKLLQSRAGRSRSSFKSVRKQGLKYVLTLFLTDILRTCITILWGLLLIVPGIIYSIRTSFYEVVIVSENLGYRTALNRSKEIVKGKTWQMLGYLIGLFVIIFLPVFVGIGFITMLIDTFDPRLIHIVDIFGSAFTGFAIIIFYLSLILLYDAFKKA